MKSIFRRWRALWNPDMYHGWGKRKSYFEGWYFKVVSREKDGALAIIPGISHDAEGTPHAFIQVMDGLSRKATYHEFSADEFRPSPHRFELDLAGNFFSPNRLSLNLTGLCGELELHDIYPWPSRLLAPGIMGWYSFVPFMECYHGVVSVDHRLSGQLNVEGKEIDFSGGKGYIEKDWGRSFPSAWIWMQTNDFGECERTSLMASVANIPWVGSSFVGFIVGFLLEGHLYEFATYNRSAMSINISGREVHLIFRRKQLELRLVAHQAEGTPLIAPIEGAMAGKVNESLTARVEVELRRNRKVVFQKTGHTAGMEMAGEIDTLLRAGS
jgi:tocopherol cyclase